MIKIKKTIIDFANKHELFTTQDIVLFMKKRYTRQYIQRLINQLIEEGELIKKGSTKGAVYTLIKNANDLSVVFRKIYPNKELREHVVWDEIDKQIPFKNFLKENVYNILIYAFSEMLNNAIDHSQSKEIQVTVQNEPTEVSFIIMDFGVGVFDNVMEKNVDLKTPEEVVQDLLKGKLTTDPQRHSGEGIFFVSKICDFFALNSKGHQLKDDKFTGDYGYFKIGGRKKGTTAFCTIKKNRTDTLNEMFMNYNADPETLDFDKTEIKIKLYAIGRACISRSQAKRVLSRLENFKKVILDFDSVSILGQGFADEVFRVYKLQHPEVEIIPINMNESVKFMFKRVRN